MFKRHKSPHPDLSTRLRSEICLWNVTPQTSRIGVVTDICTICVDVHAQLFAVGTSQGEIRVYDGQFKQAILITPNGSRVKQLQFARPRDMFKLLCIDSTYTLHVWNLDVYGNPVLQASQKLDGPIYRISTCHSHSHALVATQSGDVATYDLATLKLSPYKISSILNHSPATDVALLPHRLNHVLISYPGAADSFQASVDTNASPMKAGAVLYDLLSREVTGTYKQPSLNGKISSVTGLALHPGGQHFAAGYDDGTIRIWDINSVDVLWAGSVSRNLVVSGIEGVTSEPVFKMEWIMMENSDGSSTSWLVILGGLPQSDGTTDGISVVGFDTAGFHSTKTAFSSISHKSYLFPCSQPAQDFAVLPADDTLTALDGQLLVISGSDDHAASVDAFKFPPNFVTPDDITSQSCDDTAVGLEFSAELEESEERSRTLAATLEDLKSEPHEQERHVLDRLPPLPAPISLPFPLFVGATAILSAGMVRLNKAEYLRLVMRSDDGEPLNIKAAQYRIMITQHADTSVRFHDVSILPGVNLSLHPIPLDHLTIHVFEIAEIALRPDIHNLRIVRVVIARGSLEGVVQLSTGEIVVLGLGLSARTQDVLDDEIIDVSDVRDHGDIFTPRFILQAQKSNPDILCLSDIGFLALTFQHGLLLVVDMRRPKVILRDMPDTSSSHDLNAVESLCWVVSGLGDEYSPAPRLLVSRHDGTLTVFTLKRCNSAWEVDKGRTTRHANHSLKTPLLSVVFDAQTGMDCRATPLRLAEALDPATAHGRANASHCFWAVVNRKEMRLYSNITGERVAKVALSSHGAFDYFSFVNAHDSSVLVGFTRERAVVYSLPALDAIHTFQLPVTLKPRDAIICTSAGDILETFRARGAVVTLQLTSLLAHSNSSASGTVNFRHHKYAKIASKESPRSPVHNNVSPTWGSNLAHWIQGVMEERPVTGDEMDQIFTGPRKVVESVEVSAKSTPTASSRTKLPDINTNSTSSAVSKWGQDMYQQLTSAATERGERLGDLQEHFQHLEAGSKDLVSQAKHLAEKQAAKRWFL